MNEQQFELHMKVLERVRCGIIDVETAVQEIKAKDILKHKSRAPNNATSCGLKL